MAKKDFLVDIDLNNQQLLNATLQNLGTHPSTTGRTQGWIYWNTADKTVYVYTGQASPNDWLDLKELYNHPDYSAAVNEANPALTGATVIDRVTLENGHIKTITTRNLTTGDIGAAKVSHTHNYSDITGVPANTILANNTGSTDTAKAITGAQLMVMLGIAYGTAALLTTGTDTDQRTWTAKQISDFVNTTVNNLSTVSNLSIGNRTANQLIIDNSNGTSVAIPAATSVYAGLITSNEKVKLGNIEPGANNYTHPNHTTANEFSTAVTSGLKVLSKMSVAEDGHVTEIAGRNITAADLANVIFNNAINSGVNTTWSGSKIYNEIQDAISQAQTGALQYKDEYNPNTNTPDIKNNTSILIGYTYVASAEGQFIGTGSKGYLEKGDMIIAKVDNPGSTLENWQVVNKNIPEIVSASTTVKGIIEIATVAEAKAGNDNTRAITPNTLKAVLDDRVGGYAVNFGDGATTSFTITHGLNTQDVVVQIQRVSDRTEVIMDVKASANNSVDVNCNVAPTSNQYRAIIKK